MRSRFGKSSLLIGLALAALLAAIPQTPVRAGFQDAAPPAGAPPNTRGAGARPGLCGEEPIRQKIYALVPPSNMLRTTSGNPTLYLHLPAIADQDAIFEVIDENGELTYETTFSIQDTPAGIYKIEIPGTVNLKSEAIYEWFLYLSCDRANEQDDELVKGLIQRLDVAASTGGTPLDRANYYAENGIWQQAFEAFWGLRTSNPQAWQAFMESAKLESYVDAELIN